MKALAAVLVRRDFRAWVLAVRPLTLPLAATPVLMGAVLARANSGGLDWLALLVTLIAAIAIQIGTNLLNDVEDFEQGNDTAERRGPDRATAKGWLEASDVKFASMLSFALAAMAGLYLVALAGWPIFLIGVFSLLAGFAYSAGPWPLSHTPLSELFVFLFFGVLAVAGTYYLQTGQLDSGALLIGAAMGSFAAAVLHTNNTRDISEDEKAGRLTLAMMMRERAWMLYLAFLILPFVLLSFLPAPSQTILPLFCLPFAVLLVQKNSSASTGMDFNRLLVATIGLQLLFASLFSIGLLV